MSNKVKEKLEQNYPFMKDVKIIRDEQNTLYASIPVNNHRELCPVRSKRYRDWLFVMIIEEFGIIPHNNAINEIIRLTESLSIIECENQKLNIRIGKHNNAIYYDLTNQSWQSTKISPSGWSIENSPDIFKRFEHQAEQVIPSKEGDISKIFKYVNIKNAEHLLFKVYLVSCFVPGIPHPLPILFGEKGSSKTTAFKIVKKIVDPSVLEAMSFPKSLHELVQLVSHHWWLGFDNISTISTETSDALCKFVTGESYMSRKLYKDDEDNIKTFQSCIALNGINIVARKEDLLDRSILFKLERIKAENRLDEAVLWTEFSKDRPTILGGIFDILSRAMSIYAQLDIPNLPRMADFAKWGYSIAEALGNQGSKFLEDYTSNIKQQNTEAVEANPVTEALVAFMETRNSWSGKASELLNQLETVAKRERIDFKSKLWARSANALARSLNQMTSNLNEYGISYQNIHTRVGSAITLVKERNNLHIVTSSQNPDASNIDASETEKRDNTTIAV